MADFLTSDFSRVFLIEDRAGPTHAPLYLGFARAGTPSFDFGDVTSIRNPDPDRYGQFQRVGKIIGEPGDPELPIAMRYTSDLSTLLRLARNGCEHDIQVHIGTCQDPRDFNGGWDKILVLEAGRINSWGLDNDLGALGPDERNVLNEESTFIGNDLYEVKRIIFSALAGTQVVQEVIDVAVCDRVSCGACGVPSDGCDKVFAIQVSTGGSPGAGAELIYSADGGGTWSEAIISTLAANEDADALGCVGTYLVVISQDSGSLHYASLADIVAGTAVWAEVTTGFTAPAGAPRRIFSLGPAHTWIVGAGGYIYFSADITNGVTAQNAGVATTQALNAVHAFDTLNVVAVGNSNAVVVSRDGGLTWTAKTGPAVGIALNTVYMRSEDEWFVGAANGNLYYTQNGGDSWSTKAFPGSAAGSVRDIQFSSPTVGWMAHNTAAPAGRVLRTIDGGNSWYVAPEGVSNIPANDYVGALATCADVNTIYGGGLADNAVDGFVVKGS